ILFFIFSRNPEQALHIVTVHPCERDHVFRGASLHSQPQLTTEDTVFLLILNPPYSIHSLVLIHENTSLFFQCFEFVMPALYDDSVLPDANKDYVVATLE